MQTTFPTLKSLDFWYILLVPIFWYSLKVEVQFVQTKVDLGDECENGAIGLSFCFVSKSNVFCLGKAMVQTSLFLSSRGWNVCKLVLLR